MNIRIEAEHHNIRCYIDNILVQEQPNISYPTLGSTAAVTDDTIILKIANLSDHVDSVEIKLDCDAASEYEAITLSGDNPKTENSFEHPLAVSPVTQKRNGAGRTFFYEAPAYSLNILKLKKLTAHAE